MSKTRSRADSGRWFGPGTQGRWPISLANTILVGVFLTGSVVLALLGNVGAALLLAYFGVMGVGVALYARRANSRDITRINAIEYRDERDKSLAAEGFAVVGAAALILLLLAFIIMVILGQFNWYVMVILLTLLVVWGVANSVAVRRR
jgi:hypothetical protein